MTEVTESARVPSNMRRFRDQHFTVWRCGNCRSLHSKEPIDFARYYANYYIAGQRLDYFTRATYGTRLKWMRAQGCRPTHSLLDYGCGTGHFVRYLQGRNYRAQGYDLYLPAHNDRRLLEQQYDVVTAFDVIEHVSEPAEFLDQMIGLLSDNGLLIVGTPNAEHIDPVETNTVELHQPFHRHILSEQALLALAAKRGLTVQHIERRYYLDTLFPAVNTRFLWEYVHRYGSVVDVLMEPPRVGSVLCSPQLLFYSVAGYFFPPKPRNMILFFRNLRSS